jgi:glucose dehydrogenase
MSRTDANSSLAILALAALLLTPLSGMAQESEDGQWTMPGKNYASTRYSGLDEINAKNAKGCTRSGRFPPESSVGIKGSRSW